MSPYEQPPIKEWLARASAELRQAIGVPVKIYAFGIEPDAGHSGLDLKPEQMKLLDRTDDEGSAEEEMRFRMIASASGGRHLVAIGDLQSIAQATHLASKEPRGLMSILAVPVFNPNVFQPSPVTRPLLGVLAFGIGLAAEDVVKNSKLQLVAQKYADLVAKSMLDLANRARPGNVIAGI